MKLRNISVAIVLMSLVIFVTVPAQIISDRVSFKVPLTVSNAGNANMKDIFFGGHRNATYCIDADLGESELPPVPPSGVFDVRFIDSRTTNKCMGEGMELDLREWSTTVAIKDTIRVKFQPGDPGYPVTFSWPANLNEFYSSATLTAGSEVIDMLTQTSIEVTDDAVTSIRIIATKIINSVNIENEIPQNFAIYQNYPNPFNPSTKIKFAVPVQSNVDISVFDILGRKINTLVSENLKPNVYSVEWNGTNAQGVNVASGIYYCKMNAIDENGNSYTQTLKLLLMK